MAASSVLVVDDDPETCTAMSDVIADLGYQVDVAHDGLAALELFKRQFYGLALLDYRMPGMSGVELYCRLKQERAETVGILVTAFAAGDMINDATKAGIRQVLPKPVDFGHLIPIIKEVAGTT
jgi:two-component system, NtrC family, response regulator HydG